MQALIENVKNSIVGAIRGTGEIANAVTETVSGSLTTALRSTGSATGVIAGVRVVVKAPFRA